MSLKYEKPYARNLGESFLTASGKCKNGGSARNAGPNCESGGVASGETKNACKNGNSAGVGCNAGGVPN